MCPKSTSQLGQSFKQIYMNTLIYGERERERDRERERETPIEKP